MAERGGGVYKRMDARPYTRKADKVPRLNYIKGVPHPKIHLFEGGDPKGDFALELSLISDYDVQIKHNALEASRVAAVKALEAVGPKNFFLKIRVYPHHVLRLNPLATGAGADRFSQGMSKSFGKVLGTAARILKGQKIVTVRVNKDKLMAAKDALRRAKMKLPVTCRTLVEDLKKEKVKVVEKKSEPVKEEKEE